jgi:hypothetical protein
MLRLICTPSSHPTNYPFHFHCRLTFSVVSYYAFWVYEKTKFNKYYIRNSIKSFPWSFQQFFELFVRQCKWCSFVWRRGNRKKKKQCRLRELRSYGSQKSIIIWTSSALSILSETQWEQYYRQKEIHSTNIDDVEASEIPAEPSWFMSLQLCDQHGWHFCTFISRKANIKIWCLQSDGLRFP